MRSIQIRAEQPADADTIRAVTSAAFDAARQSSGNETAIVDELRDAGALTISLVAVENDEIIGHVAFSPVAISGDRDGWFGLGPVSVRPDRQGVGVGQALIRNGLEQLRRMQAAGCVVLGEPAYYGRFGFASDRRLRYGDTPSEYLQRLSFKGASPQGEVVYHAAFAGL